MGNSDQSRAIRALAVTIALLVGAAGLTVAVRAKDSGAPRTAAPAGVAQTLPTVAPAPSTTSLDTGAIVDLVDPAVVDITTRVGGGSGAGTGMVLTSSGLVLTNNHVIEGATRIEVQIGGTGPKHPANVLGYNVVDDVALLQIEDVSGLATITAGDPAKLRTGDRVVAIGNALGASGPHSVNPGRIVALNRTIAASEPRGRGDILDDLIQIDARLQPGDSGGPLVNSAGQVVGMNTAASVFRRRTLAADASYAIPIDEALDIAHQIQAGEKSDLVHIGARGVLGVQIADGSQVAVDGAAVVAVEASSPADRAGMEPGDVITAIDGDPMTSVDELQTALFNKAPGERVSVSWTTAAGANRNASITLVTGPPA